MAANRDNRTMNESLATYGRGRTVRLGCHEYTAYWPVHLTACTLEGRPFSCQATALLVCDALEAVAARLDFVLYAYCVMPDHVHVLVSPGETGRPVADYLQRFKSFTTAQYRQRTGQARLWQSSAHDRVLRPREAVMTVAAYIANNPVRAGLVQAWIDWPYTRIFWGDAGEAADEQRRQMRRPEGEKTSGTEA